MSLLEVRNLVVEFPTRRATLRALDDISFEIAPGEILGVVGESGAGKSLTGASIIGLLEPPGRVAGGEILLEGQRIDNLRHEQMRHIRGRKIGAIFQDPLTSLNPLYSIGRQLVETIQTHLPLNAQQARERAIQLLKDTGIPAAEQRIDHYPHQFSGGMRQRVVIALALAAEPKLIVADEPTTVLDVSIQAQIIGLLSACREHGAAVMLITHDMGVIAETCDRVAVMYAGRIAEIGPVHEVINHPAHPYTAGLDGLHSRHGGRARAPEPDRRRHAPPERHSYRLRLQSALPAGVRPLPRRATRADERRRHPRRLLVACRRAGCGRRTGSRSMSTPETLTDGTAAAIEAAAPLVRAEGLAKTFDVSPPWLNRVLERKPRQLLHAVDEASFSIQKGQTLALVGESGCGKSTVARLLVGLYQPTRGSFFFRDQDAHAVFAGRGGHHLRRSIQMIFQDPYASLNPRWRVADIIAEPLHEHGMASSRAEAQERVANCCSRRPGGGRPRQVPAPVLGRAAPAHLHCPRAGHGARVPGVRRAHLRARRPCRRRCSTS